jgi:hypothetical protein
MRTSLIAAVILIVIPLLDPTHAQMDQYAVSDIGCAHYGGVFETRSENEPEYKDKIAEWKRDCENHPYKNACEDTMKGIRRTRGEDFAKSAKLGRGLINAQP